MDARDSCELGIIRGRVMDQRTRVAHHEAAHIWVANHQGAGIPEVGLNIDAPSSVEGAFGHAWVHFFEIDPGMDEIEQMELLARNTRIICAGAASDAKITGVELRQALENQPGDQALAIQRLRASPLIQREESDQAAKLVELILTNSLDRVAKLFAMKENWEAVRRVALAAIRAGGKLSKSEIEAALAAK